MPNRYFRREWDELRSGDHAAWGAATFLFEITASAFETEWRRAQDC